MQTALLTPEQAAEQLQIGRTRVYAEMASGRLASVKVGKLRRVPALELGRFVERLLNEQTAGKP